MTNPVSLHKYLYANADPVGNIDPSGYISIGSQMTAINVQGTLSTVARVGAGQFGRQAIKRAVTATLKSMSAIRREVRRCIQNQRRCRLSIPLIVTGSDKPNTSRHIHDAQLGQGSSILPAPFLLKYKNRSGNRQWYNGKSECRRSTSRRSFAQNNGNGGECDEFPYFKSAQGGPNNYPGRVSLRLIPQGEGSRQGGQYSRFVRLAKLRTSPKKRFIAVGLPNFPSFEYYPNRAR